MRIICNPNNPSDFSADIANHKEAKHFKEGQKKWAKHGIILNDINGFKLHIERVIVDKDTQVFKSENFRDIYYNKKYKTLVIVDPSVPDKGNCWYAKNDTQFKNWHKDLRKHQYKNSLERSPILKAGDKALYNETEIRRKEKQAKDNFKSFESKKNNKNKLKRIPKQKLDNFKLKKEEIKLKHLHKHKEVKIESDHKKAQIAALQKKREQDAKIKLEAQKIKQTDLAKLQQAKIDRAKEQAKIEELKRKQQEKKQQEELERQRQREARLKALEEARKKALEEAKRKAQEELYSINKNDITRKL